MRRPAGEARRRRLPFSANLWYSAYSRPRRAPGRGPSAAGQTSMRIGSIIGLLLVFWNSMWDSSSRTLVFMVVQS